MNDKPIHIIIADDHQLFAEGLISLLKQEHPEYLFTHIHRGDLLIKMLPKLSPELILLDIKMPGIDGIKAIEMIRKENAQIHIIMLSTYSDAETINTCIDKGANAFLLKNAGIAELRNTIQKVLRNEYQHKQKHHHDIDKQFEWISNTYKITRREWEILQYIKVGETNQSISKRLHLSIYTTETHRKNIMQKLKLKSPTELILFLVENNL